MTNPDTLLRVQLHVTQQLLHAATHADVARVILHGLLRALGAHAAGVRIVNDAGTHLDHVDAVGYPRETLDAWRSIPLTPGTPITDAVLTRECLYLTADEWNANYAHLRDARLPDMLTIAAVPLISADRVEGSIGLSWNHSRDVTPDERAFIETFAHLCAVTLARTRLTRELERREARFRKYTERSNDVTVAMDEHGVITYITPSVQHVLGYAPDELLGVHATTLVHPDDKRAFREVRRHHAHSHEPLRARVRLRHKLGGWLDMESIGQTLLDDPDVQAIICNVRDVTQTTQAIRALRRSERTQASNAERYKRILHVSREETLHAIGLALEYRHHEARGHTDRVMRLSERLAIELDLPAPDRDALRWGAYLHDAGKIAMPDAILFKPGPLTDAEWQVMRQHPTVGFEMLRGIPTLPSATLDVVLHHHEHWDGSGYPHGLAGEDIPLLARVFAVADVYDALRSERPYKPEWPHAAALAEVQRYAGTQFDPAIIEAFTRTCAELPHERSEAPD